MEHEIGKVTHYYSRIGVVVIEISSGTLNVGDTIHIKGHTTDFTQEITSMEIEHKHVEEAKAGQTIGLKVKEHARKHDVVYKVEE
ncbi:MAG: EF-Tu/IF-2/RF-3 family GTPase [bacterium]|nr:EF-Tu/IF-2/RF-3 family GTPase [bacterium]